MSTEPQDLSGDHMTIIEHLAELRARVLYSLVAVGIAFGVAWIWRFEIFAFIIRPLEQAATDPRFSEVHYKDIIEPFFVLVKTCLVAGVFGAIPVILYNIWAFVAPGLYEHERRLALPFVLVATIFFFGGASFCYGFVMPHGFRFLMDFNEQISQPTIMMQEHYALSVKLLLAFGVVFELPVAAMFLSAMGVITHRTLIAGWRYAVLGSFIFAAMLTPPDVITQVSMAVPLVVLYGVSIGVAWIFTSRRERAAEEGG